MVVLLVLLGIVVLVLIYAVAIYNNLVLLKNNAAQAWANIDVLLKQRHDELPKLIETCKQYMGYEKDVLEKVAQARSMVSQARQASDVGALNKAENQLRIGLGNLFAVAENYPELRADDNFQFLRNRISQLEAQIADRREFYNDTVNINNTRIEQFPDGILARALNFRPRKLLEFDHAELADVDVKSAFNS